MLIKICISDFRKIVSFGITGLSFLQGNSWLDLRVKYVLSTLSQSPSLPITSTCSAPIGVWVLNPIPGFGKDVRATNTDLGAMILEDRVNDIEMNQTVEGGEYKESRRGLGMLGVPYS